MLPHKAASCTASATQALDEPGCSKRKTPPKHSAREQSKIARDIEVLPAMTDGFITSPKGVRGVRQLVATFMAEKLLQTGASRATNSDFFALSNVQTANLGRCMAPGTSNHATPCQQALTCRTGSVCLRAGLQHGPPSSSPTGQPCSTHAEATCCNAHPRQTSR